MKFSKAQIGAKWFCPWCGARRLKVIDGKTGHCMKCGRLFQVSIEALPDPNGKTGNKECGSKVRHESLESAVKHCDELRELPFRARKNLCIYRCRFCPFLHVGHKGKVTRRNEFYLYSELLELSPEAKPLVGRDPIVPKIEQKS